MASHYKAFDKQWFKKHQYILLYLLNSRVFGKLARKLLAIDEKRDIYEIGPNFYTLKNNDTFTTGFKTHDKYSKRMYYSFKPLWWTIHYWDQLVAERFIPALDYGFATLTVQPTTGASAPCDGPVNMVGQDATFASIIAAAGNQGGLESVTSDTHCGLRSSGTSNQFSELRRSLFSFDLSSLSGATITGVDFSVVLNFKANNLGSTDYHVCGASPSTTASIAFGEFDTVESTSFGSLAYASASTDNVSYNDITLNSSGETYVSNAQGGYVTLAARIAWDMNGSFTGTWSSNTDSRFQGIFADETGTSKDPTLTVTYSSGTAANVNANTQSATFSVPTYTPSAGASTTASTQSITTLIPTYAVGAGAVVTPSTQSVTFSIPSYTVGVSTEVAVNTQVVTSSIPTYAVTAGAVVTPSTQSISTIIPTYIAGVATNVTVNTQSITSIIPSYAVTAGAVVTPSAQVITTSIPNYTAGAESPATTTPSTQTLAFSIPTYAVTAGANVTANTQVIGPYKFIYDDKGNAFMRISGSTYLKV